MKKRKKKTERRFDSYHREREKGQKRKHFFIAALLAAFCFVCSGCGGKQIIPIPMDQSFDVDSDLLSGHLSCQVDWVLSSDNVTDLGLTPADMTAKYEDFCSYHDDSEIIVVDHPVDADTGQLADHLLAVLLQITVTNVDAVSYEKTGNVFCIDTFDLCDTYVDLGRDYQAYDSWSCTWYDGTGKYYASIHDTNGNNYFVLPQGKSKTFELAFLVGNADDDFSGICLTDGSGSYHRGEQHFVDLGL